MSKTFLIRYADERVQMDHNVKFQTEVDVRRLHQDSQKVGIIFDPSRPSKINQFADDEFFLQVQLCYAETPSQVTIADSASSAEQVKELIARSYPLSKF